MPNTINIYPGIPPTIKIFTGSQAISVANPLLNLGVYTPQDGPVIIKETVGTVKVSLPSEAISVSGVPTEIGIYSPAGPPGPMGPAGPAVQGIWGETPTGAINGTNLNYTSAHPYSPGLLAVYLNGLRLRRSGDYTETGNQSFQFINAPLTGDSLSIDYIQP
jgi:hypothetical protein